MGVVLSFIYNKLPTEYWNNCQSGRSNLTKMYSACSKLACLGLKLGFWDKVPDGFFFALPNFKDLIKQKRCLFASVFTHGRQIYFARVFDPYF